MAITIDDIAKEANVSRMTVSRVINNFPYVKEETRKKINKIIKKYNYNVNLTAQNLAKGTSLNLFCLLTGIENLFDTFYFIQIIREVEKHLNKKNHMLFITNILNMPDVSYFNEKLEIISNLFHSKIIKGVIILGAAINDDRINYLSEKNVKGIIIGSKWRKKNFGCIDINNEEGVHKIISHFIEHGHKKIAIINGPKYLTTAIERENAYFETLKSHKIEIKKEYIINGDFSKAGGRLAVKKILHLKDPPTAIFTGNDEAAIGVYEQAQSEGLKIPDDISICGFDNIEATSFLSPGLTTIAQPYSEIGKFVCNSATAGDFNIKIEVPVSLVERNSVKTKK